MRTIAFALIVFATAAAGVLGFLLASPPPSPVSSFSSRMRKDGARGTYVLLSGDLADSSSSCWPRSDDDECLLLDMLASLLSSGLAIPAALEVVGHQTGLRAFEDTAQLLLKGIDWEMAWKGTLATLPEEDEVNRATSLAGVHAGRPRSLRHRLSLVADLLEPSWADGTSAAPRLRQAADHLRADEADRVSRNGSLLSVRILLPIGLCFLPALVVLGVVPLVASFAKMV